MAGTMDFIRVREEMMRNPELFDAAATGVGLLIFCGAVGKSAQFPLHVWLPDAMEGPTPVSALIHAATMVAAGVYMICRVFFIFNVPALQIIAWIGGLTALMAGLIAVQQDDIKRILAYSTLSQLGYMVMAVGLGEPPAAMFHLGTHAFFKALLFLAAGSVIHGMSHEQDIWKMGRLKERMPLTFWTFLAGALALCGLWPFSGFFSKDAILALACEKSPTLFAVGIFVAFLTTFYMFRLILVVFFNRSKSDAAGHAHESPLIMVVPLFVLAAASIFGGFFGIEQFLAPQFAPAPEAASFFIKAAGFGFAAFAAGAVTAFALYFKAQSDPLPAQMQWTCGLLRHKFYFDEIYAELIDLTQESLAKAANALDFVLKLVIRALHGTAELTGRALRLAQTGNLQTYTLLFAAGIAVVLYFMLLH